MKKCTVRLFGKVFFLVFLPLLCLSLVELGLHQALFDPQVPGRERMLYLAGAVLFGGLLALIVYRGFYLGLVWVEYDDEQVIFHLSRWEDYPFRWAQIPSERIQVRRDNLRCAFSISGYGRPRNFSLTWMWTGYRDFQRTMEAAGVPQRMGELTPEELMQRCTDAFAQLQAYAEAHPHSVRPKPEGDCAVCPHCGGRGSVLKKVPILPIEVVRLCDVCGGSGYVPQ